MKKIFSTIQPKINSLKEYLEDKKIFRKIDITYQVIWNLFLIFLIISAIGVFFVAGAGAGFFASLVKNEPLRSYDSMKKAIYNYEEVSEVYFANDDYLGTLPTEIERREVGLDSVSKHLINAIIATEDEYFSEHDGIVPKAIMRAIFQEFSNSSVQTGGSTLTQQLVKNQLLTSEVSFDRKAKEILLAMRLEHFFSKDEILEAYLNIVPFGRNSSGRNIAGVQAAAQGIFGVDAKDLNIPQAAFIAGLPQSPFGYTPFTNNGDVKENLDAGKNRMKTVLRRMKDAEFITEKEYEEALNYDIREHLTASVPSTFSNYPYLTSEVERRASDILKDILLENDGIVLEDLPEDKRKATLNEYREKAKLELRQNGYKIHTTVIRDIYDNMQNAIKDDRYFGPTRDGELEEVGAYLRENKTGAILGFVGGRDFQVEELNHATQAYRQNGSTMKPLLAYAPAIDIGALQPAHIVPDVKTYYTGTKREIYNYNRQHRGLISVRDALKYSQNVPAVKGFLLSPHEKSRESLIKMGITNLDAGEPYEATSIGGLTYGVTVEQNTNAFSTFANGGQFIQGYMIEKIEDKNGEIIYEHQVNPVEVFSPQTAYLMLDMMRDVIGSGTATYVNRSLKFNADWAGKTGTTSDFHDSWFVAMNPNVTLGVWIGYDTPKPIKRQGVAGLSYGQRTQKIWANIANAAYDARPDILAPKQRFEMPGGIVRRSVCGISGLLPSDLCQQAGLVRTDIFNAKFVPKKVDDSLQLVKYVLINDEPYLALASTPAEFTHDGVQIKKEYFDFVDYKDYIPANWNHIVPERTAPDNGKQPGVIQNLYLNGSQLSWSAHGDNDILGYRIYRVSSDGHVQKVGTVQGRTNTHFTVQTGEYYVTAVDVAGRESPPSQKTGNKVESPPAIENPEPPTGEEIPEQPVPPIEHDNSEEEL